MKRLSFFFFLFLWVSSVTYGEDPAEKMRSIWSPYCKGVSLMECPSSKAEELRAEIIARMKAGESFEAVFKDLTERYGPVLRMSPEATGREGLAYWIPWILFLSASVLIVLFWATRQRKAISLSPVAAEADKKTQARILQDLEDRIN